MFFSAHLDKNCKSCFRRRLRRSLRAHDDLISEIESYLILPPVKSEIKVSNKIASNKRFDSAIHSQSPSVLDFISLWFAKMKRSNLNIQIEKYLKSQWIDSLLIWKSTPRTLCGLYTLLVVQWWHNKLLALGIWSLRMAIKASILTACSMQYIVLFCLTLLSQNCISNDGAFHTFLATNNNAMSRIETFKSISKCKYRTRWQLQVTWHSGRTEQGIIGWYK